MVGKSGSFPLSGPTTVLQLISMAGGLSEFADAKNIIINRIENGRQIALKFNYKDVQKGKKLEQNIELGRATPSLSPEPVDAIASCDSLRGSGSDDHDARRHFVRSNRGASFGGFCQVRSRFRAASTRTPTLPAPSLLA